MIGRLALLATLAVALASAAYEEYDNEFLADKDYLQKQKIVLEVIYHYNQPKLIKDHYEVGKNYSLSENIDKYNDKAAVEDFLAHLNEYGVMPHDAVYSVFYYPEETLAVYKVLYGAKDFDTFYKTAVYLRNHINHDLFAYTFYLAVIHRPDTQYIRLPPLYEIMPYMFYNSELLEKAHHFEYFGVYEGNSTGRSVYHIPYNYSGHYLHDEYDYNYENLLNYLTEDIGWNEYYFYLRSEYPSLLNTDEFNLYDKYRGEEYLYGHKQIMARYLLERHVNGLGSVEHFDYNGVFYPGYYPTLSYPNGLPFPQRPWDSKFPKSKRHDIDWVNQYESRILSAIDAGFILNKEGEKVNLYTPEGMSVLGNIIEGNADSPNKQYFGDVERLSRSILGFNFNPHSYYQAHPSALEHFATSMRDPAFYRIYFRLLHSVQKYKQNLGPYKPEEIQFPDFKVESVNVDKLVTFFEEFDSSIGHGLVKSNQYEADHTIIKARQMRLNHQPFSINITVNSAKATKAAVKIFIGPKNDVHGHEIDFDHYADYDLTYYEIDNFVYDLEAGSNEIVRNQFDFTTNDGESYEKAWDRVDKALKSNEPIKYEKRIAGFPSRLILPKGSKGGTPLQMFVHVAPVVGEPLYYKSRIFGNSYVDNRAFGYPLDRPVVAHDFHKATNKFYKDITIYHRD